MRRLLALSLISLLLAAPVHSAPAPATLEVLRDITYASPGGVALRLDAYLVPGSGPHPAVIYVHGGAWTMGSKTSGVASLLLSHVPDAGFSVFSIDYRLAPQHPYPAAVDDVRAAIRFVQEQGARFRVDGRRLALAGVSAGGHLVSLVGGTYCNIPGGLPTCGIQGVISYAGVADLRGGGRLPAIRVFMGPRLDAEGERLLAEASPITHADPGDPPVLLVHGDRDPLVPHRQAERYLQALRDAGVAASLITLPGGNHVLNWGMITAPDWKREVVRFLGRHVDPRR